MDWVQSFKFEKGKIGLTWQLFGDGKIQKNKFLTKNKVMMVSLLMLLLASSVLTMSISFANAAVPTQTYAYIAANPNPIGVNQPLQVSMWLADPPPTASGAEGDRWIGFTVTITKPDGTTETRGPYNSDAVGGAYFTYYPAMTGTYKFQMHYPGGQTMTGWSFFTGPFDNTYLASDSAPYSVTVQQSPIENPPQAPLPTSYWTRPVNGENHLWSQVSSNWLMPAWDSMSRSFDAGFAVSPEGTAPNTAHILWTKALCFGGLVGGVYETAFFHDGRSYEYWFQPPVIISGRLYYNDVYGQEGSTYGSGTAQPTGWNSFSCVDMQTGETLFTIPDEYISFGQIYNYVSPNQAGAHAYLWGITATGDYKMYDAWSGKWILTIANVTGGVQTFGEDGSLINYNIANGKITCWNSSKAIGPLAPTGSEAWQWRPYTYAGQTIDGNKGIEWSVAARGGETENIAPVFGQAGMFDGQGNILSMVNGIDFYAYRMSDGAFQYKSTLQPPTGIPARESLSGIASFLNTYEFDGTYYEFVKATLQWVAYDVRTGAVKWVTESYANPWSMYGTSVVVAYGKFYAGGYGGDLNCYDNNNGELLWTYKTGSAGFQTPYGFWPIYSGLTVCDGKVIFTTSEHGNGVETLYTGEKYYVVDAETGANVWNISGWFEQGAIADGKLVSHNCYDNEVYCFGQGPTATTVSITGSGNALTIVGSVSDQSAGAKQLVEDGLFNVVPVVSDAYMSPWMEYLYMQKPEPTNAVGVTVKLTAIDPDCNTIDIGSTTTDLNGNYGLAWNPTDEGTYKITATFEGTNAYYGSEDTTYLTVGKSSSVNDSATAAGTDSTLIIGIAVIALIIAVVAIIFAMRKR